MLTSSSPVVEYIPNRVYFQACRSTPVPLTTTSAHYFSIDKELVYWNFCLDFGPLNLGQFYRFAQLMQQKLEDTKLRGKKLIFYSSTDGKRLANATCLLASWGMVMKRWTPSQALKPLLTYLQVTTPFHDATTHKDRYQLSIVNVLSGLARGLSFRFFDLATFDVAEYEHFERVEHGDLSWISPKFIAFAGPTDSRLSPDGYPVCAPEDYIPYFQSKNVTLVVRLNNKFYDEHKFLQAGIDHLDLYYTDGTNPTLETLQRFLEAVEATPGVVAVHCKAGLGRTGTCIGAHLMKHQGFSAREVIGWMRLCRPGMVIGPQQQFMDYLEQAQPWTTSSSKSKSKIVSTKPQKSIQAKTQGDHLNSAKQHHRPRAVVVHHT